MAKPTRITVVRGGSAAASVVVPSASSASIVVSSRAPELSVATSAVSYPATRAQIVAAATAAGASATVLRVLSVMPDVVYADFGDVATLAGE